MSWETIYYAVDSLFGEAKSHSVVGVNKDYYGPDYTVISGLSNHEANLVAEAMNEVYNQIKKDIESGRLKENK